jgi:lysozyme family protein
MNTNFELCLSHLLQHEGGYVNHPSDPGGRTNLGVTQSVWEDWIDKTVDEAAMRALTPEKVAPLYREMYWNRIKADDLASGLDYAVFDAAVNSGVSRAIKWLQMTCNVSPDGFIGYETLQTAKTASIQTYCAHRMAFLKGRSNWPTFGKGWERRVKEVEAQALRMSESTPRVP